MADAVTMCIRRIPLPSSNELFRSRLLLRSYSDLCFLPPFESPSYSDLHPLLVLFYLFPGCALVICMMATHTVPSPLYVAFRGLEQLLELIPGATGLVSMIQALIAILDFRTIFCFIIDYLNSEGANRVDR